MLMAAQEHMLDPLLEVLAQYRTPSNLKVSIRALFSPFIFVVLMKNSSPPCLVEIFFEAHCVVDALGTDAC
jgi:hypothetical protein